MDQHLESSYKQLKALADILQGRLQVEGGVFVMNMRQLGTGEELPVLCAVVQDPVQQRSAVLPLAVMLPVNEKLFEDPTSEECQAAMQASMDGLVALGGGCLCGKCNARFPRDDSMGD